jgi:hypothetical protein
MANPTKVPDSVAPAHHVADLAHAITDAMTSEGVDKMINLFTSDGEWVIMATGETFRGHDETIHPVKASNR